MTRMAADEMRLILRNSLRLGLKNLTGIRQKICKTGLIHKRRKSPSTEFSQINAEPTENEAKGSCNPAGSQGLVTISADTCSKPSSCPSVSRLPDFLTSWIPRFPPGTVPNTTEPMDVFRNPSANFDTRANK